MPVEALEEEEAEAVVHPRTQEAATKRASSEQVSRLTESPQCRVTSSFSGEYSDSSSEPKVRILLYLEV